MILTIGIPVYNGEKYINDAVNSILKCNFNWDEVEVIICDNASTDNTIRILQKKENIRVIEHSENVGFDGNLNRIFNYARGKFVWAIGADDLLVPKQITDLISLIRSDQNFGIIFVGGSDECHGIYCEFDNEESFLVESNFRSGFFPNNIINKNIWLGSDTETFIGSGWIHYAIVLQALRSGKSAITKNQYVIENPGANNVKNWNENGNGLAVGLKLVEIFAIMPRWGYTQKFVKQTKGVIKNSYPRQIIVSKIRGLIVTKELLAQFITLFKEFPSFWLIDFWFLVAPSRLYKIVAYLLKLFKYGT